MPDPTITGQISLALLSAVTEVVFGHLLVKSEPRLREWLGRDPAKLAFQTALARAYMPFARQYPQWTASLFDETFLTRDHVARELSRQLTRDGHPDPALLASAWIEYFPAANRADREGWIGRLTPVLADFLCWLDAELKAQEVLRPIFDSRALERLHGMTEDIQALRGALERALAEASKYRVVVEKAHTLVIGDQTQVTQVFQTYFGGEYITLDDLYILPDSVFGRVRLQDFVGRQWLVAKLDAFLNAPGQDRGAWVLVGEAGVGKTTFLAHLVAERGYVPCSLSRRRAREAYRGRCNLWQANWRLVSDWNPTTIATAFPWRW